MSENLSALLYLASITAFFFLGGAFARGHAEDALPAAPPERTPWVM